MAGSVLVAFRKGERCLPDVARFLLNGSGAAARAAPRRSAFPRYLSGLARAGIPAAAVDAVARDVFHALIVSLALEVRSCARTDVVRPDHPHAVAAFEAQVVDAAEAVAELVA